MVTQINPVSLLSASAPNLEATVAFGAAEPKVLAEGGGVRLFRPQSSPEVAAAQVNQHLGTTETNLKLQVDQASNRGFFQVVQARTGMVLLQVPSDEVLAMSHRIQESNRLKETPGALLDKKG